MKSQAGRNSRLVESACTIPMNRRQLLRRGVALGLTVPVFSALLSACEVNVGVDDDADEPTVEPDDDDDVADEPDDDDLDDDDDEDEAEPETDDVERDPDPVAMVPELDLETLEAETPDGTLTAQRAEDSYVGEIAEGRVIGIAFRSEIGGPQDAYEQDEIVVHLYDRQEAALFIGEIDEDGAASLQSLDGSYFDATVELVMEDNEVTGTVTFRDEEPTSFTADAASGDAGVYWAVGEEGWEFNTADWVVLADGRQWGVLCIPFPEPDVWCIIRQ